MFNTFKKIRFLNQTGRSMLEITCVLAIIGVLGIASYLGIRTGLSKTQVSKIAYTINLQANALLMTLEAENAPINEDNDLILTYNKTENGYALTGFSNDEESFAITVHGVPKDICQQAGNIMPEAAFGMVINAEDEDNQIPAGGQAKVGGVCIDDQNTLTYHFAAFGISKEDALSDYLCDEIDPSCGRCEECHNGQCELVPAGTPDPICEDEDPEKPFCSATGTCVCSSGSCGEDKACNINTGACINCPTGDSSVQLSQELCNLCDSTFWINRVSNNGLKLNQCYRCDATIDPVYADYPQSNCASRCPNRISADGRCRVMYCPTGDTPTYASKNFCSNCSDSSFWINRVSNNGLKTEQCYRCDATIDPVYADYPQSNCAAQCPNRISADGRCRVMYCPTGDSPTYASKDFCSNCSDSSFWINRVSNNGLKTEQCYRCDATIDPVYADYPQSNCATKCTNRVSAAGRCRVMYCPETVETQTYTSSSFCTNTCNGYYTSSNSQCKKMVCPEEETNTPTTTTQDFCINTCHGFYPRSSNGWACYSCTAPGEISHDGNYGSATTVCNTCSNRFLGYGPKCRIMTCPEEGTDTPTYVSQDYCINTCHGFYARSSKGWACYSCSAPGEISHDGNYGSATTVCNTCSNRFLGYGPKCRIMTCPEEGTDTPTYVSENYCLNTCHGFYARSSKGWACYSCTAPGAISHDANYGTATKVCNTCSNRWLGGDYKCRIMTCPEEGTDTPTYVSQDYCTNTCHGFYARSSKGWACYSCSAPGEISHDGNYSTNCNTACTNRFLGYGTKCRIMTCPEENSDTPTYVSENFCTNTCHGFFLRGLNRCHSCSAPGAISYDGNHGTTCATACENRRISSGKCILR